MSRYLALLLIVCTPSLADEKSAPEPIRFTLQAGAKTLLLRGTSDLPHGTRLSAAIRFGGKPLQWRKTYLMQGRFSFRLSSTRLRPGHYEVVVRFQRRGQLDQLAKELARFPKQLDVTHPWMLGTPLEAVTARLSELRLMRDVLAKLSLQLVELGQLGQANLLLLDNEKYLPQVAAKAYDRWLARLTGLGRPARDYLDQMSVTYQPTEMAQLINLLDKSEERARGAVREEFERAKVKVPKKYWPVNKLLRDARMLDPYLQRKVPELAQRVKALSQAADVERKKLAEKAR